MSKYPDIDDTDFYSKISDIYKKFKIPKKEKTLEDICFPKKFELQLPQQFLPEYINPRTPYTGVLVYHRIGAGKTCTAIRIGEKWKKLRKIIVVLPASLQGNFRNELRSLCADDNYIKDSERKLLTTLHPTDELYKEIISKSDERINKIYDIYSYNKFVQLSNRNEIKLGNDLLIIDEIQNMVSEEGTYYQTLQKQINNAPDTLRIVLLSATPMFDKPDELALTLNLLRLPEELPTGRDFYKKYVKIIKRKDDKYHFKTHDMDHFKNCIRGYVSYFRGAPPYVFPRMMIKYVRCEMSDFQYQAYKDVMKSEERRYRSRIKDIMAGKALTVKNLPNNFFIGTRIVSNVVFPNRKINEQGFDSFWADKIRRDLWKYSTKFDKIISKIERSSGKIFIYSGFKEYGGIKSLTRALDELGYYNYFEHGEGPRRYAVWSGDESIQQKDEIRAVYNRPENLTGRFLRILIGSSSSKEGLSLFAVRQIHILEPYWNQSRIDQVVGRGSRFCSHKMLPEEKRNLKVYIYIAVHPDEKETVDEYMQQLAEQKNNLVQEFEQAVKEAAIDCTINKNANVYEGEKEIECVF